MDLDDIHDHVRDTIDLDSSELPDSYLNLLCREATWDIVNRDRYWPSYQSAPFAWVTIASTHDYEYADVTDDDESLAEIVSIIDLEAGGFALTKVDHHTAEAFWRNTFDANGQPKLWSEWGGSVYLWPAPSGVRDMQTRYYRKVEDWVSSAVGTEVPDMDERLHPAIPMYCLMRVYAQQEEPQLSQLWEQRYEMYVQKAIDEIFRLPEGPIILNKGLSAYRMDEAAWLRGLVNG